MARPVPTEQFGKYQILERIAQGGMAEIFKARLEGVGGFNRLFAIKRIRPHLSQNAEYVDLLVDEAKIAGLLSHANIVQILDLGQVDNAYYVAMEYVPGRDLGRVLLRCRERGITLPVPHAVFVLIEMLKGLDYAHNRQIKRGSRTVPLNIVHRDVSPSNVLLSFQGEVKLTDFGIAKANIKALETVAGVVKGKYDYMSPEQAAGEAVDRRTDIFAAGVLLYEMLVGEHPFRAGGELQTIEAIKAGRYEAPSMANPDVPYSLELILDQALARDPDERFQTATAFNESLTRFFHDAGFIFSHSTLAAFLKGLFPESLSPKRQRPRILSIDEQETRPLDGLEDLLEEEPESPTVVSSPDPSSIVFGPPDPQGNDSGLFDTAALDLGGNTLDLTDRAVLGTDALPTMEQDPVPEPPAPIEQAPIRQQLPGLVQPIDTGFADDSPTRIRQAQPAGADEWADVETVIRPDPSAKPEDELEELELDDATRPNPGLNARPAVREVPAPPPPQQQHPPLPPRQHQAPPPPPPREPRTESRSRQESYRPGPRTRSFLVLVGLTCTFLGFAAGLVVGALATAGIQQVTAAEASE